MLVLVLYSIHSPDVLHSILLPIHPAKYQDITDGEHNELTLIYMFIYLFIDSFALIFAEVRTGNNLLSCMSKVRHLNSLTGSENRSAPVSKAIFKLFGWFSSFAAAWCGWEDSEDTLHKDV